MTGGSVHQMAGRIAELMEARLRIRGDGLAEKLRRGGRLLPRKVRREAEYLVRAAEKAQSPRLLVQLDQPRVAAAYDACVAYLKPLGARARRQAILQEVVAGIGWAVFATLVLVILLLIWGGFV